MNLQQRLVRDWHRAAGVPVADKPALIPAARRDLRKRLINEEASEFAVAGDVGDLVLIADALGDLLVVVYGAAIEYGIDLEPVFGEIHRSNCTKVGGPVRADGKILKPPGYEPPRLRAVLEAQRG